jgi:DNA polymerase-3 subunit alpha
LLESLIKAGALDTLEPNRQRLVEAIDAALRHGVALAEQAASDQVSLFGDQVEIPRPRLPEVGPVPALDTLRDEFEMLGFYLSAHPLDGYRSALERLGVTPSDRLAASAGQRVKLAGVVVGKQERTTIRSRMAFVQLSDSAGAFEVTMFGDLLGRVRDLLDSKRPLLIEGDVKLEEGDVVKVLASSAQALDDRLEDPRRAAHAPIEVRVCDPAVAAALGDVLGPHGNGSSAVRLVVPLDDEEVTIDLGDGHRLAPAHRLDLERRPGVLQVSDG